MKTQFFDKLINYVVASSLLYFFRLKRISPFFLISFENKFVNNAGNRSKRGCNLALNIGERECYVSFTQRGVKAEKLTKRNFFLQHIKRSNSPSLSHLQFSQPSVSPAAQFPFLYPRQNVLYAPSGSSFCLHQYRIDSVV